MSAPGPESIPTSADPRSKRPLKKRALTPVSNQAVSVDALFAKPDQDIRIPTSSIPASQRPRVAAPPEIVTNVQGSSAGAGSGEFHVYKASRRREYERLRLMDEELKTEQAISEFERERIERATKDDEKTRKNREKREKRKKKANKPQTAGGALAKEDNILITGIKSRVDSNSTAYNKEEGNKQEDSKEDDKGANKGANKNTGGYKPVSIEQNTPSDTTVAAPQPAGLVIHDDD